MASQAHICRIRTDLGSGAFQVTDLAPNSSQRSIYEPQGQSGYLNPRYQNDTVAGNVTATLTTAALNGLAAYIVDNVEDEATGNGATAAMADSAAAAIETAMDAGTAMGLTAVNVILAANIGAGSELESGTTTSTGSLKALLSILSGRVYTLPVGSTVDAGSAFKASAEGSFDDDASADRGWKTIYSTGALQISCGGGVLATYASTTYSYGSTTGAACVVYSDSGAVLS